MSQSIVQINGEPSAVKLDSNALGLLAAASLTAAYMGPALSIYALFGPLSQIVGQGVGFVMLIAIILTLLSAVSFGMLAKEMPSAGGIYAWTRAVLGESMGLWVGVMAIFYYTICLLFCPIIFGQFFNEFLLQLGLHVGMGTWLLGVMIMIVLAAFIVYRGIVVSSHLAFTLLIVEVVVVIALSATFLTIAVRNGMFTLKPFTFGACKNGWSGVLLALPMAKMCMCCDGATPAAEETRNAKWTVPVAVVLSCIIVGLWYVIGFSAFAMARSAMPVTASDIQNDVAPMVAQVWGRGKILVSITAMTASLGAFIPCAIAVSRVIFAMARDAKLPGVLAVLNRKFASPWNALHLVFAATLLGAIPAVIKFGTDDTLTWWSYTLGWFVGVVYLGVNIVNIVHYRRFARERFNAILSLILPGIAIIVELWILWRTMFVELWKSGGFAGKTAQAFVAAVSISTAIYALGIRKRTALVSRIQLSPEGSVADI
jgi:amino acid transporter